MKWLPDDIALPNDTPPVCLGDWPYPWVPADHPKPITDGLAGLVDRLLAGDHQDCPACIDRLCPTNERLQELRSMPYREYLQTREWKDARRGALHRARHQCELCGTRAKPLHVHHLTYKRRGHEWPDDLAVLCEDCHGAEHGR